jgi:hypothetical protein
LQTKEQRDKQHAKQVRLHEKLNIMRGHRKLKEDQECKVASARRLAVEKAQMERKQKIMRLRSANKKNIASWKLDKSIDQARKKLMNKQEQQRIKEKEQLQIKVFIAPNTSSLFLNKHSFDR